MRIPLPGPDFGERNQKYRKQSRRDKPRMGASEATAPSDASAQPTRWSPGDVSKNQLNKSSQCVGEPRRGFVQSGEKLGCIHEGNTAAAPKSFRKFRTSPLRAVWTPRRGVPTMSL